MNIFKRAWRSFLYRTRHIRVRLRVCGFCRKTNKRVLLVGVPNHSNIGDMAIALAEKKFLRACRISFASLSTDECEDNILMLKKAVRPNTLICYHGGGNLGNLYGYEERVRRMLLTELPDNPSVIFPQTVHFTDDPEGEADMAEASRIYVAHKKLTIALRDEGSLESARRIFPNASLIYSPDIVMSMEKKDFGIKNGDRSGVLLCFRHDFERSIPDADKEKIVSALKDCGIDFGYTDMIADKDEVPKKEQFRYVSGKMKELSEAGLVITDRLHGMVFSAITETPCIVFGNFNHKVRQSYSVLSHLSYIRFVTDADEAVSLIDEAYGSVGRYDSSPILPKYGELKRILLEYSRKQ